MGYTVSGSGAGAKVTVNPDIDIKSSDNSVDVSSALENDKKTYDLKVTRVNVVSTDDSVEVSSEVLEGINVFDLKVKQATGGNMVRLTLTEEELAAGTKTVDITGVEGYIVEAYDGQPIPSGFALVADGEIDMENIYRFMYPSGATSLILEDTSGNTLVNSIVAYPGGIYPGEVLNATPQQDGEEWSLTKDADFISSDGSIMIDPVTPKGYDLKTKPKSLGGLNYTGLHSHYFAKNLISGNISGKYIPLIKIKSVNIGKMSVMFEILDRETTQMHNYYGKYYFNARSGATNLSCIDFYDNGPNECMRFDDIVYVKTDQSNVIIYKRIRSTAEEYFIVNVIFENASCYSLQSYYSTVNNLTGIEERVTASVSLDSPVSAKKGQSAFWLDPASSAGKVLKTIDNEGTLELSWANESGGTIAPSTTENQILRTVRNAQTQQLETAWADEMLSGFETYSYIDAQESSIPYASDSASAILVRCNPLADSYIKDLSVLITQGAERVFRLALYDKNRNLLGQTAETSLNQTGLVTRSLPAPVQVLHSESYFIGLLTSGNGYLLSGRTINIQTNNILPFAYQSQNNLAGNQFPETFSNEVKTGSTFVPYLAANAGA